MIDTIAVQSRSRTSVTHTLYVHSGKAIGCSCEHRLFQPYVACSHMTAHDRAQQAARETARGNYELSTGYNSIPDLY